MSTPYTENPQRLQPKSRALSGDKIALANKIEFAAHSSAVLPLTNPLEPTPFSSAVNDISQSPL